MRIVIAGGAGQIGRFLARHFHGAGHEVTVLSRHPASAPWPMVEWDGRSPGAWEVELEGADAAINLSGRSVNCRYTAENRRRIMDSRVESTRVLGQAIAASACPPRVWLQAGTATIYAHRYDAPNDERTGILGGDEPGAPEKWRFSIEVARAWERTLDEADTPRTRKVILRSAMVMEPERGGVFDTLLRLVRRGLGGRAGDGRQFISWVHGEDLVRAVDFLIEHDALSGPVNVAAPEPLPNADFMCALRRAWGIPFGLSAPAWALEIATRVMGTESELILKSRRVIPSRLLETGFTFQFPSWPVAAEDLCRRWQAVHAPSPPL